MAAICDCNAQKRRTGSFSTFTIENDPVYVLWNQRNGNAAFIVGKRAYIVRDASDGDDGHNGLLQMIAVENGDRRSGLSLIHI